MPFLSLTSVSKTFGGARALDHVDFEVEAGEVHCLVGENGCGKSTLIKIVAGVHQPDAGSVVSIGGRTLTNLDPATAKLLGVQVIFQDLSLFQNLSVAENIAFDLNLGGLARPARYGKMREIATSVLQRLGFSLPLNAPVSSLPIAERQVVAICRGLAAEAKLLFMDEPTASLTRAEVKSLLAIVRKLKADGIAVVFVSHKLDEVIEVAERVTVLRDGRKVGTYPAREVDAKRIGSLMTGRDFEPLIVARDRSAEPIRIETRGLTRKGEYEDVSLTVRAGEVVGLTGLLGAGRTELALTLFGMASADSGEILMDGKPQRLQSNQDAIRAGIAYVSEDRLNLGLNMKQSIGDNLTLSVLSRLGGALGLIPQDRRERIARDGVERLKIKIGGLALPVNTLSGGNQQRVVLAKWLATKPRLLILDSPTVGVDIGNKAGIYEIIRELAKDGVAVLVITDEIQEAMQTCDRLLHMKDGRLVGSYVPGKDAERAIEEAVYA